MNWRRCGKFGTEKKFTGWNVTHTKMLEQTGLNCARTTRKLRATKIVFKVERCGNSLLTSNRKMNLEKNCWFLNKTVSKKCCESCSQWSVHCKTWNKKSLMKAGEREQLALMTADVWVWVWVYNSTVWVYNSMVWVYNSTVYNAKGKTWSGSPLWKEAQQEVRQHWFIVW